MVIDTLQFTKELHSCVPSCSVPSIASVQYYPDLGIAIINVLARRAEGSRRRDVAALVDLKVRAPEIESFGATLLVAGGIFVRGYRAREPLSSVSPRWWTCFPRPP